MCEAHAVNGDPGPRHIEWAVVFGQKCMLFQRAKLTNIAPTHILMDCCLHVSPVDSRGKCIVCASCSRVLKLKMNAAHKS